MSLTHANISIFVPHVGCHNMCSFCNQRYITGKNTAPRTQDVIDAVNIAINSSRYDPSNTEIAFFGGSFTAINRNYMIDLLKTAHSFVEKNLVSGIRISTRPDAVDDEILTLLKKYGVTSIELGAQSLNDTVLKSNNRGHTASDVINASNLIKQYGFNLGLQMMTGLYNDCDEYAVATAHEIIKLKPQTVRIYPTIVLKNTDLAALYIDNIYKPQTLETATELCSKLLLMFEKENIKVIRLGLHSIEKDSYIAGPWHPAFSELCYSKILLNNAKQLLTEKGSYILYVNPSSISKMIGQHKENINALKILGFDCVVKSDALLSDYEIKVERR
ncbi:MAG: radical SAM protein [Clostridia bacterium]|nr:radical SAM protein [Clostridia bacterium]